MNGTTIDDCDRQLVQIVDAAFAEAARRSGEWLVCRPGCTQCCVSPFPISRLDARRLRQGLEALEGVDPPSATRVRNRAEQSVERLSSSFPGDPATGLLAAGDDGDALAEIAEDEICPALDPATGTCDLYAARPMTCRTFGPPLRHESGLGVCELCYHGATDAEIAACEVVPDPEGLEVSLNSRLGQDAGLYGHTLVAFALVR